jgi:hypothetical protein
MGESRRILLIILYTLFLGFSAGIAFSQEGVLKRYEYLSPLPFSLCHNPETEICIRFGEKIDILSLKPELFEVTGDISGKHQGNITLSYDRLTIIFKPDEVFSFNEKVTLHLEKGILTQSGILIPPVDIWFTIRQKSGSDLSNGTSVKKKRTDWPVVNSINPNTVKVNSLSFLDFRFPEIVSSNQPSQGNILTTLIKDVSNYLYVFDNNAIPIFAMLMPHPVSDLKPQPGGKLTFYDSFVRGFIELDSYLNRVDTFLMKNGYKPDAHEILLLKNNHVIMFSYDPRIVDMGKIVTGGNPAATVTGLVIQELDEKKNLIFQWRSWDYFNIVDSYADLLSSVVDYVHGNSLDADTDTTLVLSSRNMNEVTKINKLNGKLIWRLGGKNNEFVFENDPRRFAGQHSAIKQKGGTLTLFDNGVGLDPLYSRGIEYQIDEIQKKVKLVNEYRHIPDVYANISGNLQRLDNGNTLIFWGPAIDHSDQFISEYNQADDVIFEARFDMNIYPTYRAYKSPWKPELFTFSTDTLAYKGMVQNTTVNKTLEISNNSKKNITITSAHHKNLGFYVKDLPETIEAGKKASFTVAFPSYETGKTSDNIFFCMETDSTLITRSLFVSAENTEVTGIENQLQSDIKIRPNPGKESFNLEVPPDMNVVLKVIDLNGKTVWTGKGVGVTFYHIDLSNKPNGFYILYLEEVKSGIVHAFKLIKQE